MKTLYPKQEQTPQEGGISQLNVGIFEMSRTMATVEGADGWAKRLVRDMNGISHAVV